MKPLQLTMSAFGSYAGVETVDFEKIKQGIFLITGDTGSGKTTIFDGVSFALFGETSGGKREGSMMRSQYAAGHAETYVNLRFAANGKVYEIFRSPSYMRMSRKKNKDGVYTEVQAMPKVRLILPDGKECPGTSREISLKIQEIIGVDRSQFTQIAMIAQGEYLKLLHASSKERKEIFSKLFNTRVYEIVQKKLKERDQALYGRLEDNQSLYEHERKKISFVRNSCLDQEWNSLLEYPQTRSKEILNLMSRILEEGKQKEAEWKEIEETNRERMAEWTYQLNQAKEVNTLLEKAENAERKRVHLEQQASKWLEDKQRLILGRRAELVDIQKNRYVEKQEELQRTEEKVSALLKEQETMQKQLESAKISWKEKQKKWQELQPLLEASLAKIQDTMPLYEEWEKRRSEYGIERGKEEKITLAAEQADQEQKSQKERIKRLQEEQELLAGSSIVEAQYHQKTLQLKEREQVLAKLHADVKKLLEYGKDLKEKQDKTAEAQRAYDHASSTYDEQNRYFIAIQAGIMASKLLKDEPCPVCGSRAHPSKASLPKEAVTEAEVEALRKSRDREDHTLRKLSELSAQAKESFAQKQERLLEEGRQYIAAEFMIETAEVQTERAIEECREKLKISQKTLEQARKEVKRYQDSRKELAEESAMAEVLETVRHKRELERQEVKIRIEGCKAAMEELGRQLPWKSKEKAEAERRKCLTSRNQMERDAEDSRKRMDTLAYAVNETNGKLLSEQEKRAQLSDQLADAAKILLQTMETQGFSDEEAYQKARLVTSEMNRLEGAGNGYEKSLLEVRTICRQYREQTKGKVGIDIRKLENGLKQLSEQRAYIQGEMAAVTGICARNEEAYQTTCLLLQDRERLEEAYQTVHALYQAANGKLSGTAGLDFQTYVQRQYFEQMIDAANRRLLRMNDGQFLLQCRSLEALGKQGEVGLDLDIYSVVTDKVRDIKTLSGGESFMAALAMALGTADVIQNTAGKVKIDTMFIDEGFGSLDDDSRMKAIRILQELAGGRRLIGIISHVTELKEQMGRRLIVEKSEKGSQIHWDIDAE